MKAAVFSGTTRISPISPAYFFVDSNGNGIPDSWEMTHFGNLTHSAIEDGDGDGLNNLQEYESGTDPLVPDNPSIKLTLSPDSGGSIYTGSLAYLTATASTLAGTITEVDGYLDATSLGAITTPPYQWQLPALTAGTHQMSVVAHSSTGAVRLVSSSPFTVIVADTDGDGLGDAWELQYFLTLAKGPGDLDTAGRTYLYDYTHGIDPTDYYNGQAASLSKVQGDNQTGWTGKYLDQSLQVKVMNGAVLLTNAPVTFTTTNGGFLATRLNEPQRMTQNVSTDTNGIATIYYYQAADLVTNATVQVTANPPTPPVSFTVDVPGGGSAPTNSGAVPPGVPPAPPADLDTNGAVVLYSEAVATNAVKYGFDTFLTTTPPQKYLARHDWDEHSPPEPATVAGNEFWAIDGLTGTQSTNVAPRAPDMAATGTDHFTTTATTKINVAVNSSGTDFCNFFLCGSSYFFCKSKYPRNTLPANFRWDPPPKSPLRDIAKHP